MSPFTTSNVVYGYFFDKKETATIVKKIIGNFWKNMIEDELTATPATTFRSDPSELSDPSDLDDDAVSGDDDGEDSEDDVRSEDESVSPSQVSDSVVETPRCLAEEWTLDDEIEALDEDRVEDTLWWNRMILPQEGNFFCHKDDEGMVLGVVPLSTPLTASVGVFEPDVEPGLELFEELIPGKEPGFYIVRS